MRVTLDTVAATACNPLMRILNRHRYGTFPAYLMRFIIQVLDTAGVTSNALARSAWSTVSLAELVVRPVARRMKQLLRLMKIIARLFIMQEMYQTGDDSIFVPHREWLHHVTNRMWRVIPDVTSHGLLQDYTSLVSYTSDRCRDIWAKWWIVTLGVLKTNLRVGRRGSSITHPN